MEISQGRTLWHNFLGQFPDWYRLVLIIFLIIGPPIFLISPFVAGWLLVAESIFTLAITLKCYPLLPDGLLAIGAVFIGMADAGHAREEVAADLEVLLLLMLIVVGIYFMKQLLLFIFTRLPLSIRSKMLLSLSFCVAAIFLSVLLDALTVAAMVISVAVGLYDICHRVTSPHTEDTDLQDDSHIDKHYKVVLEQLRGFPHSLMMHASVGATLGGVMTMVDEPQNLITAKAAGWHFDDFFLHISPVIVPVLICGLLTCLLIGKLRWFGYGGILPKEVHEVLQQLDNQGHNQRTRRDRIRLIVQATIGVWLATVLALHLAEVGLISLSVIILATSLTGITDKYVIGKAFTESLSFTTLLTMLLSVVAVIIDRQLFSPVTQFVLQASERTQLSLFYIFNDLLSSISDNVFVGTTYIDETKATMEGGTITLKQYELLTAAINTSISLPSVATPNGQAAFPFLLTSILAPLIRLSYGCMVWMALPYTLILTLIRLLCAEFMLAPVTGWLMQVG